MYRPRGVFGRVKPGSGRRVPTDAPRGGRRPRIATGLRPPGVGVRRGVPRRAARSARTARHAAGGLAGRRAADGSAAAVPGRGLAPAGRTPGTSFGVYGTDVH